MLNNADLRHLQACELLIAAEIKRICEKNKIRYFMISGTLLGAVRHKGFIPWDDDMDFGMERVEYERFCKACQRDLSEEFALQTWDSDEEYPFSFGKLRLKNTHIREAFASPKNHCDGIFVDLLPFDNVPDDLKLAKKQGRKYFFYKRALWMKKGYGANIKAQGIQQRLKYAIAAIALAPIPYQLLKKRFKKVLQKYNATKTSRLVFDAPYRYEQSCIERKWLLDLHPYPFEEYAFPAFQAFDACLSRLYGDYMKLPEPSERRGHDILEVDFGEY